MAAALILARPCPVCVRQPGAESPPARELFAKDAFPHLKCPARGLIYVSPLLTPEAQTDYWREEQTRFQVLPGYGRSATGDILKQTATESQRQAERLTPHFPAPGHPWLELHWPGFVRLHTKTSKIISLKFFSDRYGSEVAAGCYDQPKSPPVNRPYDLCLFRTLPEALKVEPAL